MREAQLLGMPTTATMMFGSIETRGRAHRAPARAARAARRNRRIHRLHPLVLRAVQNAAARQRSDRPRVPARAGDLAPLPRQLRAPAGVVADAGIEDGPARALLRLRRHGRHDHRGARRARRRQHERSDAPRSGKRSSSAPASNRSSATRTGTCATTSALATCRLRRAQDDSGDASRLPSTSSVVASSSATS